MTIEKIDGFTSNLDSDYLYIDSVRASIYNVDADVKVSFYKKPDELMVHIVPSSGELKQGIIDNLLAVHKLMGLKIIFSKSLKISKTVSYSIEL